MSRMKWHRAKQHRGFELARPEKRDTSRKPVRKLTLEELADRILADPRLLR